MIVLRHGLGFELKFGYVQLGSAQCENIQHDVFDLIRIFYDALGGALVPTSTAGDQRYLQGSKAYLDRQGISKRRPALSAS